MPEAKTFGGGGPPVSCQVDIHSSDIFQGQTADVQALAEDSHVQNDVLVTVNVVTTVLDNILCPTAVAAEAGFGLYGVKMDGVPMTQLNFNSTELGANVALLCRVLYAQGVAAGAHTFELYVVNAGARKVYCAWLKVIASYCGPST